MKVCFQMRSWGPKPGVNKPSLCFPGLTAWNINNGSEVENQEHSAEGWVGQMVVKQRWGECRIIGLA